MPTLLGLARPSRDARFQFRNPPIEWPSNAVGPKRLGGLSAATGSWLQEVPF